MAQNEILENLLDEFRVQREELKKLINELETFKNKLDGLFPSTLDKRYIRFFEEKIKTVTELFKTILDMRKEINKTLKDEFELRRKIDSDKSFEDEAIDIRKILSKYEDKVQKLKAVNLDD